MKKFLRVTLSLSVLMCGSMIVPFSGAYASDFFNPLTESEEFHKGARQLIVGVVDPSLSFEEPWVYRPVTDEVILERLKATFLHAPEDATKATLILRALRHSMLEKIYVPHESDPTFYLTGEASPFHKLVVGCIDVFFKNQMDVFHQWRKSAFNSYAEDLTQKAWLFSVQERVLEQKLLAATLVSGRVQSLLEGSGELEGLSEDSGAETASLSFWEALAPTLSMIQDHVSLPRFSSFLDISGGSDSSFDQQEEESAGTTESSLVIPPSSSESSFPPLEQTIEEVEDHGGAEDLSLSSSFEQNDENGPSVQEEKEVPTVVVTAPSDDTSSDILNTLTGRGKARSDGLMSGADNLGAGGIPGDILVPSDITLPQDPSKDPEESGSSSNSEGESTSVLSDASGGVPIVLESPSGLGAASSEKPTSVLPPEISSDPTATDLSGTEQILSEGGQPPSSLVG